MKFFALVLILFTSLPCFAQKHVSAGRQKVDAAYKFQEKLNDSTATIAEVINNWSRTAADADVKKDPDALAIALGCEGILEIQRNQDKRADSILKIAMLKFRIKDSKAYFLVTYAELERDMQHYNAAMTAYEEIVHTMDSLPQLWDIDYYRSSGYAPYAYAIDACYGMEQIAAHNADHRKYAVELLTSVMEKHNADALGAMALTALHELGSINDEGYKFKLDLMASRRPQLRTFATRFQKQFQEPSAAQETSKHP